MICHLSIQIDHAVIQRDSYLFYAKFESFNIFYCPYFILIGIQILKAFAKTLVLANLLCCMSGKCIITTQVSEIE